MPRLFRKRKGIRLPPGSLVFAGKQKVDKVEVSLIDYDHTIHVFDTVESYCDILGGMLDIYLSTISNRMNEVMKVLTVISTIFIPLTFITGLYGMNFQHMPELAWRNGYFIVLGVMGVIGILMVIWFRRKRWL